jgi:hypothetical protein
MPGWLWALIVLVVLVVAAVVVWRAVSTRRTQHLRERFGPEYDRAADDAGSRRRAEAELAAREQRREQLNIRPLPPEARERYVQEWQTVQAQFVDSPAAAVAAADALVSSVMRDRGYPMDDFEQRAADISVDHPQVVENYRAAHRISEASKEGTASTEDLRQATQHYRSLFEELLSGDAADDAVARGRADRDGRVPTDERERTVG